MMKTSKKNFTQQTFADMIGGSIDQPGVSRLLRGKDKVSWPLAERLALLFPTKSIKEWKYADAEDLNRLYRQLEREAA